MEEGEKAKILLIEDDKFISRAYSEGLKNAGFDLTLSYDGKDALDKVKENKPDLILLDLILPVKSGFEFLSELRMLDEYKDIPVIIVSNLGQESDIKKGKELGVAEYLIKSDFFIDDVIEKVKFHLSKSI